MPLSWMFSVWSDKCVAFGINQALRICLECSSDAIYFSTHQLQLYMACSEQCSICSMSAQVQMQVHWAGVGAVRSVHCVLCRVQYALCQIWRFVSWNRISQLKVSSFTITSKKTNSPKFFRTGWDYWFFKAWYDKQNFNFTYLK